MRKWLSALALASFGLAPVLLISPIVPSCRTVVDVVLEPPGSVRAPEFLSLFKVAIMDAVKVSGADDPAVVAAYYDATQAGDPVDPLLASVMRTKFGLLPTMESEVDDRGRIALRFFADDIEAFLGHYLAGVVVPAQQALGDAPGIGEQLDVKARERTHRELLRLVRAATPDT